MRTTRGGTVDVHNSGPAPRASGQVGPVRVRPYSHLFNQGVAAVVVFMTPVFIVLYVLTYSNGRWVAVLVVQAIATLLVVLAGWGYFGTAIWVSATEISERGFFGRTQRFSRSSIGSVVLAETDVSTSAQTIPQLFVCDHDGTQLVRMRGQFWSRDSMELVKTTLDVPYRVVDQVLTVSELRRDYPGLLYWFERHPFLAALGFTSLIAGVGALVMAFLVIADLG